MTGRSPDTGSLRQDAPVFQPLPASPDGARANALIGAFLPVLTGAAGAAVGIPITLRAVRNGALRELAAVDRRAAHRLSRNASEDGVNRLLRTAQHAT